MTSTIEWHKTSERLPEHSGHYLVYFIRKGFCGPVVDYCGYRVCFHSRWYGGNEFLAQDGLRNCDPEYWAELPRPEEE